MGSKHHFFKSAYAVKFSGNPISTVTCRMPINYKHAAGAAVPSGNAFNNINPSLKRKRRILIMKRTVLLLVSLLFVVSSCYAVSNASAAGPNFCRQSSQNAMLSCEKGARSDYFLALGKCDNLSVKADRKLCRQQALVDRTDDLQSCDEQYQARKDVCITR